MKFDKNIYYDTVAYMQGGKTWITFYRKKSEAMAQRYDSGGRCHIFGPEIGWHGSSGGPE